MGDMTVSLGLELGWVVLSGVVRSEGSDCVSAIYLLGAVCLSSCRCASSAPLPTAGWEKNGCF